MKTIKDIYLLLIGLACLAITIGFIAGASESPVVSVVIPAIFGLGVTAIGLIAPSENKKENQTIEEDKPKSRNADLLIKGRLIGVVLIIFSFCYVGGLLLGANVRIYRPFQQSRQLPWANENDAPIRKKDAILWIAVQEKLLSMGYTQTRVKEFYSQNLGKENDVKETSILKGEEIKHYKGELDSETVKILLNLPISPSTFSTEMKDVTPIVPNNTKPD